MFGSASKEFGEYRPFQGRRENYGRKHATLENRSYSVVQLHVWIIFPAYFKHFWNIIEAFLDYILKMKQAITGYLAVS
jgi:hypothetical protein